MVKNHVLLPRVPVLVHEIDFHVLVAGIHLAATGVYWQKNRLDTRRGLRHQAGGARGSDGEEGNIAPAILHHIIIQLGVSLFQTIDKGIVLLPLGIIDLEGTPLLGHVHGGGVRVQRDGTVHFFREIIPLIRTVTDTQRGQHIALGGDAHTGAATLHRLALNLLPEVALGKFDLFRLRVLFNLLQNLNDLLFLQVDDVVHDALR